MSNKENDILDKLINKSALAAQQLLDSDELEVKLAQNMTEEDEKNPKIISLEKLMGVTEKLNNMNTKHINAKLKHAKMQAINENGKPNKTQAKSNFQDMSYEDKKEILYNDPHFFKAMHDYPKQVIMQKYGTQALNCIDDEQAYKSVIFQMIEAERVTLEFYGEMGMIKKLSKKQLNEKLSHRSREIDQELRQFHKEASLKKESSSG